MEYYVNDDGLARVIDTEGNVLAEGEDAARMAAKAEADRFEKHIAFLEREHPEHPLLAETVQAYRAQAARLRGTARGMARRAPDARQQPRNREHRSGRTRGSARRSSARSGDSGSDDGGGGEPEPHPVALPAHVGAELQRILDRIARRVVAEQLGGAA